MENKQPKKKVPSSKQIVALVGALLLSALYLAALAAAILERPGSGKWFMGCLLATVAVPLLVWIYSWIYGKVTGRHSLSDPVQNTGGGSGPAESDTADRPTQPGPGDVP